MNFWVLSWGPALSAKALNMLPPINTICNKEDDKSIIRHSKKTTQELEVKR